MKKIFTLLCLLLFATQWASADINFGGQSWHADTLQRRLVGPGVMNTIIRLPDYPLNFYVLEADLTNPNLRVETTIGQNQVGVTEKLSDAVVRNRTATRRPFAACNANFWVITSNTLWARFMLNSPDGGVVRNDSTFVNTNTSYDKWNGGPHRTGASAYTHDRRVLQGSFMWYGKVTNSKIANGTPQPFYNINRRCVRGEMALWNGAYTATREFEDNWTGYETQGYNGSNNYYLTLKEGSAWAVNKDMHFVVAKIVKDADRQTLGNYDACLTTTGGMKDVMNPLEVGDELTISSTWMLMTPNGEVFPGEIEQFVEGNATLMKDRVLTERNFDDEYNYRQYSRTCYGVNADGTKLYMFVADQSNSPLYGRSGGCSTEAVCEIMKVICPDIQHMVNYDAGGSAEMLVHGEIINTTTEGTPRGVCSGWMLEAVGEEDNEVAMVRFDDFRIDVPIFSSYTPRLLGYNQRGELVDDNITDGFTLQCTSEVGTTSGAVFYAAGEIGEGRLMVDYNGMRDTIRVNTVAAVPGIKLKPSILLDDRAYPIEVNAPVGLNTFMYDPAKLGWTVADEQVLDITDGVILAKQNGQTDIYCSVGEYRDTTSVKVEISDQEYINQTWDGWTITGAGAKNFVLDDNGNISFTYSSHRAPHITMDKEITFYSLPDTIAFTFTCGLPCDYVQLDVRNYNFPKANYMKVEPEGGFEAGQTYTVYVDLATMGGTENVSTYPITLKQIKFAPNKSKSSKGDYQLNFSNFYSHYAAHWAVGDINADRVVDGIDLNALVNILLGSENASRFAGRADVNHDGGIDGNDLNALINIILGK